MTLSEAHDAKLAHKYRLAIEKYNQAASLIKKATGDDEHLFVGMIQQHIGSCYLSLEEYELAKFVILHAIKILVRNNVEESVAFEYRSRLAEPLVHLGELDAASALLKDTMEFFERSDAVGPDHFFVAIANDTAQMLHRKRGEYAKAQACARRALQIVEKQLGPKDPFTMDCRLKMAELFSLQGKHDVALAHVERIFKDQQRWSSLKEGVFVIQVALQQMIECGSLDDAQSMALKYLDSFVDEGHDLDSGATCQIRWLLANIYWLQGEEQKAEALLQAIRTADSSLLLTTVSRFFSSKPNTRFSIEVDEFSDLPAFQYTVILRLLNKKLAAPAAPAAARELQQALESSVQVQEVEEDELEAEEVVAEASETVEPASGTSGASGTDADARRLSAGCVLVASFESPDGGETVVPDVEVVMTEEMFGAHAPDVVIKNATPFTGLRKGRFLVEVKVYSDASRDTLLDTHRQLINSSYDSSAAGQREREAIRKRALQEREYEQQDRQLLSVLDEKYGDADVVEVAMGRA